MDRHLNTSIPIRQAFRLGDSYLLMLHKVVTETKWQASQDTKQITENHHICDFQSSLNSLTTIQTVTN